MEELKQKIKQEISQLPKERQDAVNSVDWALGVEKISNNFGLIREEKESLLLETGLLLIGSANIEDFSENIADQVKIPESQAEEIALQIVSEIIVPVTEKMATLEDKKINVFSGPSNNPENSTDSQQKIFEISNKYKLPIDKMGDIDTITKKFINGEISSIKYESELSLISELPSDKILEIINDINENIIKPKRNEVLRGEIKKEVPLPPSPQIKKAIPVPPYAQTKEQPTVPEVVKTPESESQKIYKESGIEIVKDGGEINKPNEQPINNIVTSKLFGTTSSKNVVNDYSIPKITPLNKPNLSSLGDEQKNKHDAYREII